MDTSHPNAGDVERRSVARTASGAPVMGPRAPLPGPPVGSNERRNRNMGWRSRDILRAAALVFGLYVFGKLLWFANSLIFVVFLAVLFGLAVGAAVDRLEALKLPYFRRGVASALIVFGSVGGLVAIGALMAPTMTDQIGVLRRQIPTAIDKAEGWVNSHRGGVIGMMLGGSQVAGAPQGTVALPGGTPATGGAPGAPPTTPPTRAQAGRATAASEPAQGTAPSATESLKQRIGSQLSGATKYLFPFLSSTLTVIGGLVLIIFLAIYIGAEPQLYHDGLMHLFPHRARARAGEVLTEMATVLRKWLLVQLVAMVVIGVVTTVVMLLLGVKAAFALGFIAGLLEFIPTVGPILAAVPAIAMGFADSPQKAFYVVLAYWGIQFLENNLLIPQLMRGGMDIPPALTLVAQALFTLVFGFIGLMVAVPVTAAVLVPIKMLYVNDVVGDDMPLMSDQDAADDDDD
jgi:predicted PurR-regulated permease PerM